MEAIRAGRVSSPWPQRIMAALGALLLAYGLATQILLLAFVAPTARGAFKDMGVQKVGALAWIVAWRWAVLAALLLVQAAVAALAARRRPYGTRLLIMGAVAFLLMLALVFVIGVPSAGAFFSLISSLESE